VADFYAARDHTMPPLPWPSIAPPITGTEVRHFPVQPRPARWQGFNKACRLAECHSEQHFHGQARLDRGVDERSRSAPLAGRSGAPVHLGIEPDRQ